MLLLTGFSLGCLAVTFLIVLRDFRHLLVGKVFLWVLFSASAFLLSSVVGKEYRWLTGDVMTTLPAAFWLLCLLAFAPRPKAGLLWTLLALYSFVAPALSRPFGAHSPDSAWWLHWLGFTLPQYSEYILTLGGLWITAIHWRDDLVESRRQLRAALIVSVGTTLLCITVSLNNALHTQALVAGMMGVVTLLVAFLLLRGREGVLLDARVRAAAAANAATPADPPVAGPSDAMPSPDETSALVAQLTQVMNAEHFYRTEKLTLKMLAEKMSLPEYRLRALINKTFGYRNFNEYVNQLRIEEACQRLSAEPDTPIQNIALDVGYRTLSSFNRAFRDLKQQTPTEFRQARP